MTKFAKMKALAAVAGACVTLFAATPANAYVYGVSRLEVKDLQITTTRVSDGAVITAATDYNFAVNGDASIKFTGGLLQASGGSNLCSGILGGATNCTNAFPTPVLDLVSSPVANSAGNSFNRSNNDFSILNIKAGNHASADSQITTAALVQGIDTSTKQVSEVLLNANGQADADTRSFSRTTLVATIQVLAGSTANQRVQFSADNDVSGEISDILGGFYSAAAGSDVSVSLTLNGSGGRGWEWKPDGDAASGCTALNSGIIGSTCVVGSDTENLNYSNSISSTPDSFQNSSFNLAPEFGFFRVDFLGLGAGTYSLLLEAKNDADVTREYVPEPGSLALLGLALAGLGLTSRRRNRQ